MPTRDELLRSARLDLIDFLSAAEPAHWATPSLCAGWTVQDVAAHLAWAPLLSPHRALPLLLRSGLRLNTMIADSARRWSERGRDAILEQLRENAARGIKPFGLPLEAALVDALVHALDIRVPLADVPAIPTESFRVAADFLTSARWPMTVPTRGGAGRHVGPVRVVVPEADWSFGDGPSVEGPPSAVLLLLAGRQVASDAFTGPGVAHLTGRRSR